MFALKDKEHVIFDLDGTISAININWLPWRETTRRLINSLAPDFDFGAVSSLAIAQNELVRQVGPEALDTILNYNNLYEAESFNGHTPVRPVLEYIAATTQPLSVWTNNTRHTAHMVLSDLGLQGRFQNIITRNDVDYIKPDPQGFDLIRQAAGLPANAFAFVGDSENDRLAAVSAGLHFIPISMFDPSRQLQPPSASV